jgi:hypothetical protein
MEVKQPAPGKQGAVLARSISPKAKAEVSDDERHDNSQDAEGEWRGPDPQILAFGPDHEQNGGESHKIMQDGG